MRKPFFIIGAVSVALGMTACSGQVGTTQNKTDTGSSSINSAGTDAMIATLTLPAEVADNVAGIEIENSTDSEVYGNTATHNTGGILIFDLPDLPVKNGAGHRVFKNTCLLYTSPSPRD